MGKFPDILKKTLIRVDRFHGNLEKLRLVTYQDKIRLQGPLYRQPIIYGQQGHDRVTELLSRNSPLMISRLGSVELSCLRFYTENRRSARTKKRGYPERVRRHMANPAGFFPLDDASLDAFCELYLDELKHVDLMAVWFNLKEDVVCNTWSKDAGLIELHCLEPYKFKNPWSARLAGKKVLVVHPFAESIAKQYREKRSLLFTDPNVLPDFELSTLKAVQSIAGSQVDFTTWFDAYRHMCDQIASCDFDTCLIGAGAYGLPLAAFAKKLGKQAVHLGGITQLLFGIKGRRWETQYATSTGKLFNEHWVRPLQEETPSNKDRIEKGCYW